MAWGSACMHGTVTPICPMQQWHVQKVGVQFVLLPKDSYPCSHGVKPPAPPTHMSNATMTCPRRCGPINCCCRDSPTHPFVRRNNDIFLDKGWNIRPLRPQMYTANYYRVCQNTKKAKLVSKTDKRTIANDIYASSLHWIAPKQSSQYFCSSRSQTAGPTYPYVQCNNDMSMKMPSIWCCQDSRHFSY